MVIKSTMSESVKVIVRSRPLSEKEQNANAHSVIHMYPQYGSVEIEEPKFGGRSKRFTFDAVYDGGKQLEIYDEVFRPIIDSVINGFNGTIFAYGQTGAGKTYTMEGIVGDLEREGVIPNSFRHIFSHIARTSNIKFLVSASYLEVYNEEVRDLLCDVSGEKDKKLEIKEKNDGCIYVKDLKSVLCTTIRDLENVMNDGRQNRSIGKTNMNIHSSRSHAIFIITIESCECDSEGNQHVKTGKLNLVDLAGSERQAKTGAKGLTLKESIKINLSLSTLGNVISALSEGKSAHVPYRDSKLTRLLQDSLGGNSKTIMIANIGPASTNYSETLTTLRYANRAKNIKNKPVVNVDPTDAMLMKYQEEIQRLKEQIALKESKRKKKKQLVKNIGDVIEETDKEESDKEDIMQKLENLMNEERVAYLNELNLMTEEKEKILNEIKEKDEELRLENEAKEKLQKQLEELEAKLVCGGKDIIDHTNEQEQILRKTNIELAAQKQKEIQMKQKLLEEESSVLNLQGNYNSLQEEVDLKTKKLKKFIIKLQHLKDEVVDEMEINSTERREKEEEIDSLTRDLKLSNLIIDNFINPVDKRKFLQQVKFDEDENNWMLYQDCMIERYPPRVSAYNLQRPTTSLFTVELALKRGVGKDILDRHKGCNVASLDFIMPRQRRANVCELKVDPFVKEAARKLLTSTSVKIPYPRHDSSTYESSLCDNNSVSGRSGARSSHHHNRQYQLKDDSEKYPVPRGLVKK